MFLLVVLIKKQGAILLKILKYMLTILFYYDILYIGGKKYENNTFMHKKIQW
jgi:hypothetical protein